MIKPGAYNFFKVTLLLAISLCGPAWGEELRSPEVVQSEANQLYDTLMSPYCPGRTLSACPSDDARQLRENIFGWLQGGATVDAVIGRLKVTYGEKISAAPVGRVYAWWIPAGVVVLFGVFLVAIFRGKNRRADGNTGA